MALADVERAAEEMRQMLESGFFDDEPSGEEWITMFNALETEEMKSIPESNHQTEGVHGMICDKCIKKSVCKLCDGSNIQGCIEFYRSHEEVLREIREEVANWHKQEPARYVPNYDAYARFINLIDRRIEENDSGKGESNQ